MKIVIASTSEKKVNAVKKAFTNFKDIEIVTIKAPSGVNEQPMNEETLKGAHNRLHYARKDVPDADIYISIENGIFTEGNKYIDKAVVTIMTAKGELVTAMSDGVEFPSEFVYLTKQKPGGLKDWTVGKVMAEHGYVQDHADPHYDLSGKSRVEYLDQALDRAIKRLRGNSPARSVRSKPNPKSRGFI